MGDPGVLLVDPDSEGRERTAERLREAGFTITNATTLAEGTSRLDDVSAVVSEYSLPDGSGLELVSTVRKRMPDTACILFTDADLSEMDSDQANGEITEFVPKGTAGALDLLVDLLEQGIEARTQTAYPVPEDERSTVSAVQTYAPDPEQARTTLDRLARIAARVFEVPMAGVGLIDEQHQEFIACHGVSLDTVPREETICTYAILEDGVMVVEDTREDPRFEHNEALADAEIRFYASANLTTPDGEVIGTFCVYDREPHSPAENRRETLQLLADEAAEKLDLERRLRERGDSDV